VNSHPTQPITVAMANDKDMTPEKHEEWCTMIEELTNMLTMIHDALQMINADQHDLIHKMQVMVGIRSASTVGDPIVNRFNHALRR
jgi:hypothetical protein